MNHSYILQDKIRDELSRRFIARFKGANVTNELGIYFIESDDEAAALARHVEGVVFKDAFDNDDVTMHREYDQYNEVSCFILAFDHIKQVPIGVVRVIKNSDVGLKTITAIGEPPWSCDIGQILKINNISDEATDIYDIATLAVLPDYRASHGSAISFNLYLGLFAFAANRKASKYLAILDEKPFNLLKKNGFPVRPFEATSFAPYLGSANSVPAIIDCDSYIELIENDHHSLLGFRLFSRLMARAVYYDEPVYPYLPSFKTLPHRFLDQLMKIIPAKLASRLYYARKMRKK
jgi:hypothetical protein